MTDDIEDDKPADPAELFTLAKFLTPREVATVFAAGASATGGITHDELAKIIARLDSCRMSMIMLSGLEHGLFQIGWDEEEGDLRYRAIPPEDTESREHILAAVKTWDDVNGSAQE